MLAAEINNWGRWGAEDERGTLNLITPEVLVRAAGCIRSGQAGSARGACAARDECCTACDGPRDPVHETGHGALLPWAAATI